jgi:hypothetical protein
MASPPARKSISIIRDLIENPSVKRNPEEGGIDLAIYYLGRRSGQIVGDPKLLTAVLELGEDIAEFRGKGCQIGAESMSQFFGFLIRRIAEKLPECDLPFISFSDAREAHPSLAASWDALAKLSARAQTCVQGPLCRSRHVGTLRAEAWYQLGRIAKFVVDPRILELALDVAENPRADRYERHGAMQFEHDVSDAGGTFLGIEEWGG